MNRNLVNEIKYVAKGVVVFDVLIILMLLITSFISVPTVLGLILGSLVAIVNFLLIAKSVEGMVEKTKGKAQAFATLGYGGRMLISAVVLFLAARISHLNIFTAAIGLLSTNFVVLAKQMIHKLKRKEA